MEKDWAGSSKVWASVLRSTLLLLELYSRKYTGPPAVMIFHFCPTMTV